MPKERYPFASSKLEEEFENDDNGDDDGKDDEEDDSDSINIEP